MARIRTRRNGARCRDRRTSRAQPKPRRSCASAWNAPLLGRALAAHEAVLEARTRQLQDTVHRVRRLRVELDRGTVSVASVMSSVRQAGNQVICDGTVGKRENAPRDALGGSDTEASFVSVDRLKDGAAAAKEMLAAQPELGARVRRSVAEVVEAGGDESDVLLALITVLETEGPAAQVVDMLEEGLDAPTQEALICFLRRRGPEARPLIVLTRSTSILDVDLVGPDETIILCPANHSPPMFVAPYRGTPGYESLTTCLATPAVRVVLGAWSPYDAARERYAKAWLKLTPSLRLSV